MLSLIEINVICCADVRLFCYKMSTRPVVVAAAAAVSESFLQQLRFIQCNHCRNVREMCVFLQLCGENYASFMSVNKHYNKALPKETKHMADSVNL